MLSRLLLLMLLLLLLLPRCDTMWLLHYHESTTGKNRLLCAMRQQTPLATTEQVWRKLSDRLRQFVRSRVTSAADVDDILQEVFLRIHQKLDLLRREERLDAWVFQITRNVVADHFRGRRDVLDDENWRASASDLPEPGNLNAEIAGCVVALLECLPNDQKRAVSMYELQDIPQQEIAHRESISLSAAKSRIQRGRQSLKDLLRDCCQFQFDRRGNILHFESKKAECCAEGTNAK